jgi:hypothetical protein
LQTTALQTTALQTTALQTTALQTTALRTTALRTTALQTTALQTTALQTTALQTADWHAADHWLPAGVPGVEDDVYIPSMAPHPSLSGDAAVDDLVLEAGAVLDLGTRPDVPNVLTVEGLLTNDGTLRQTRSLAAGATTPFLRIMNQAGSQIRYYGLEITPAAEGGDTIQISISGNQRCAGRYSGVKRCYTVDSPSAGVAAGATVRLYFREAERDGLPLEELVVYGYDGQWRELAGPFLRGGGGEGTYVEATVEGDSTRFALDLPGRGVRVVYMPVVQKRRSAPPEPIIPPTPSPTPDVPGPYVVDSTTFTPYSGASSTYLVGRVTNPLAERAGFAKVYYDFYDAQGSRLANGYSYTCFPSLAPGMTSPFISIVSLPVSSWTTYTLSVQWSDLGGTPLPLAVAGEASSFDASNAFHVTGTASNPHGQRLESNRACAAMLDGGGKTIGVWWDDLADLDPGGSDAFDVKVSFWKGRPDQGLVAGYELQAYSRYGASLAEEASFVEDCRAQEEELRRRLELDLTCVAP